MLVAHLGKSCYRRHFLGRILGSSGPLPVLDPIDYSRISAFQEQFRLRQLIRTENLRLVDGLIWGTG
jgi:tetrahydromethanopterin S-methyltransferase subunit A